MSYDRISNNCAHYVAKALGLPPPDNELSFALWLGRNTKRVLMPRDNDIVLMKTLENRLHVGVWRDGAIWHNDTIGCGAMTMPVARGLYQSVEFLRCK